MAYLRIKNISFGYTVPAKLTTKIKIAKLRVYGSLENFFTFDHLGTLPIDPEEIEGYSMWNTSGYNLSRSGVGVPTYKSASFGIQAKFLKLRIMKKILIITALVAVGLVLTRCEDFLDRPSLTTMNDVNYWTSENNLRLFANGFYSNYFVGYNSAWGVDYTPLARLLFC